MSLFVDAAFSGTSAADLQRPGGSAGVASSADEAQSRQRRLLLSDPRICAAVAGLDAVTLFSSAMAVWFFYHLGKGSDFADWRVYLTTSLVLSAVFVVMALSGRAYNFIGELRQPEAVAETLKCFMVTFAAYVTLLFFFRYGATFSRATLAGQFVVCGSLLICARSLALRLLQSHVRRGKLLTYRAVLIGETDAINRFRTGLAAGKRGVEVVATFNVAPDGTEVENLARMVFECRGLQPDRVVVLLPDRARNLTQMIVRGLAKLPVSVLVAPGLALPWGEKSRVVEFAGTPMLRVVAKPLSSADRVMKRMFDAVVAGSALVVLAVPLLLLMAAIRIDSPGPAMFRQRRRGFNQQEFTLYKFRTMSVAAPGSVFQQTLRADPRITRLGAMLRKYNLDELPQLVNVLRGEMSLVGPRPHAVEHDDQYVTEIEAYANRNKMKPGITGLAQINGCRGATETTDQMADRVRLDVAYVDSWSIVLDLKIIIMTVFSPHAYRNAF